MNCPKCGKSVQRRGLQGIRQTYQCTNRKCDQNHFSETVPEVDNTGTISYSNESIHIIHVSMHKPTQEELIKKYEVNLDDWELKEFTIKDSMGYRKDKKSDWQVDNGRTIKGKVEDSGKMLVVTFYHTQVKFAKKISEIDARNKIQDLIDDAKKQIPSVPKINYSRKKDPVLLELSLPDLHLGRVTWNEQSGEDYDIKLARIAANKVIDNLLSYSKIFEIEKIIFPIGNDWNNVNSKANTTVNGTVQQEDTRWQKSYKRGRQLAMELIDKCAMVAPTDIVIVSGNHDAEKIFYMGDGLEIAYENNPNVMVDNSAKSRKYYLYGEVLLGFTHGEGIKKERLPLLMALEAKEKWAQSSYREMHMGHIHHKHETRIEADEDGGIMLRRLRSLAPADAWTFDHGYVGSLRAAESFIWHPKNGLVGQFTAIP